MKRALRVLTLASSLATFGASCASCASAPSPKNTDKTALPTPVAQRAPEPAPPPRAPSPLVSVMAPDKLPANLAIDGDVAEWGSLLPPPAPPPPPDPNLRDAPSHLAFVVTKDAAFLAADLAEVSKDGIWFSFAFADAPLPNIGFMTRGGGVTEFDCETDPGTQEPLAPETAKHCQEVVARHAAFVEAHEARFERTFRLNGQGLFWIGKSGALEPVPNSLAAMKRTERGMTVEARIPVAAYPRASEVPLTQTYAHAIAATAATPPDVPGNEWIGLAVPAPLHFEPHAALRAAAYERTHTSMYPLGFSYHPAEPDRIETVRYPGWDASSVVVSEKPLYVPERKLGDLEIGYASAVRPAVAVFKAGAFVELVDLEGEPVGSVERNKEIHVFSYSDMTADDSPGLMARWSVLAVAADGSTLNPINQDTGVSAWSKVYEIHSDKFDWFGVRGVPFGFANEETPRPIEILWRLDKQLGGYMPTTRELSVLPPQRPRKKG